MIKSLIDLKPKESGIVLEISGGEGIVNRLNALGIISGKRITKVSSMIMRGPVTVQVDRAQVAIGFGMAAKIIVKADEGESIS